MKQYQPLYLKYRPQKLSELIGQGVVTRTLTNAILYNKIVHAYLFCGPRGTGKTSCARILAKSLNCAGGITVEPCSKCVSCQSVTEGNSLDVIEIDAASHRKVEDAENLINRVNLGTYGSRFKIYIIDEVHMLTDHAFNALLKTIEEPPPNVIFILATTEEYKVILTIISRCQKLDFKLISQNEIDERIIEIAKQEKINLDKSVISFISKKSQGCLRDAVSLLDQISVLQTEDKPINSKEVFELFGTVDKIFLFKLLESVLNFDKEKAVMFAEDLIKCGKDVSELFKNLLELVIDLAKAKIDTEYRKILSSELGNDLKILEKIQHNHLLKIIDRLHDSQSKLRFALSQELQFMVEIMSMLDEDFLISMQELKERINKLEGKNGIKSDNAVPKKIEPIELTHEQTNTAMSQNAKTLKHKDVEILEPISPNTPASTDLDTMWKKIISLIESNPTKTLLLQSESYLLSFSNDLLEIGLSKDMFLPRLGQDTKKQEMILKAAKLAGGMGPQVIKFRFLPKPVIKKEIEIKSSDNLMPDGNGYNDNVHKVLNHNSNQVISNKEKKVTPSADEDEFTKTVKDLLGAKEID
ncbi:MAG: DNA polymerase III subunit gamma/tau [Candidatus Melainabacteria bacterium]|nr:DNA polymerase III subunit gamma/tau [Candidatus Melainabacteria bacterium]